MNDSNGFHNGNGNGNGKAFVLTQPKSAEEVQRESILATMPKLRRECSRDPRLSRSVGAKWLFGQISDLSFLHNYGGDGFGKIFISIKDLHRIFGHDEASLTKWRDLLCQTGWIWVAQGWPKSQWGIAGVCRQPELFSPHSDYVRTMAKASAAHPKPSGGAEQNGKTEDFSLNTGNPPVAHPKDSGAPAESFWSASRILRVVEPSPSGQTGRKTQADHPEESHCPPGGVTSCDRAFQVGPPGGVPLIRETPIGNRSLGATEGAGPPINQKDWAKRLSKMFPAELEKLKRDLIQAQKQLDPSDSATVLDLTHRIRLIDGALYGRELPKGKAKSKAAPIQKTPSDPTEEEILAGAEYLVSVGRPEKLTQTQQAALAKAGK